MTHDMLAEIDAQRELREDIAAVEPEIVATLGNLSGAETVHFVGSGDSLFASRAIQPLLQTTDGPEFRSHTAYEFTQYVAPYVDSTDLVVVVSVSGNSIQTVRAAEQAEENGGTIVGVTNSKDGILYRDFPNAITIGIDTRPGWVPGTLTYLGFVAALAHIGIRLSGDTDRISVVNQALESVGSVVDDSKDTAQAVAENLVHTEPNQPFYVIGGGPSRATAEYGAAKFIELGLPRTLAVGQESEEFAHQEFWALEKTNPVFVVAPSGRGFERTFGVAEGIREFGNDLVVVTDSSPLADLGKYAFELEIKDDLLSPLLTAIPIQLIVYYYALELGLDPDNGTHIDPHRTDVADAIHSEKQYE